MSDEKENIIDIELIKLWAFKALKYWYILLTAIVISVGIAKYFTRFNIPYYTVSGRILVKDEYTSWGEEYFLPGMELVSERNRLANDVEIIKSFPMMLRVIDSIPELHSSYYLHDEILPRELYKSSPFTFEIIEARNTGIYDKTWLRFKSKFSYTIKNDGENSTEFQHMFGDTIEFNDNKYVITRNYFDSSLLDYDFYFFQNNKADLAKYYLENTSIETPEEGASSILTISLSGYNRNIKEIDVINEIMNAFIFMGLDEGNLIAENTIKFIDSQLEGALDSLNRAEYYLETFKQSTNKDRIDLRGSNVIADLTDMETKILDLKFSLDFYQQTIDYIQKNDDAKGLIVPYFIDKQSVLFELMTSLINLYTKKNQLNFEVKETNNSIVQLDFQIDNSKAILIENLKSLQRKGSNDIKTLESQFEFLQSKLIDIPTAERNFITAQRTYEIRNKLYTQLLEKKQEAHIAKASSIPKAKILDYATKYRVTTIGSSNVAIYKKYLGIGVILSLLIIAGLIFAFNKIEGKSDISVKTKIPIIGQIGHNSTSEGDIFTKDPKSLVAESFRDLRTNLKYLMSEWGKVVLLTSPTSGDGKTFCSINIALSYALLDKKVIIIGCDLRKPKLHSELGFENRIGLTNVLIDNKSLNECIIHSSHSNLDVLPSGPIPPNPSELLSSTKFEETLLELKQLYDYIIIDTAPIGMVTDTKIILNLADVLLIVLRQKQTTINNFSKILPLFKDIDKPKGIIVNDIKPTNLLYKYGYTYGYGYDYKNYYYQES